MEASGSRIIEYPKEDAEFSIWDIADIHLGNAGCSKEHLKRDIERIRKDQYSTFLIGGDYMDAIFPGDPRFDPETFPEDIMVRDLTKISAIISAQLINYFNPIKDKCLGVAYGNHEHKFMTRNSEMFIHDQICASLNAPNMRYSGWADLYFVHNKDIKNVQIRHSRLRPRRHTARLRCVLHHGFSTAATAGGKINALKRLVDSLEADLVMMGHVHEQFAKSFTRLTVNENCTEIKSKITMGMITGSYLRTYLPDVTSYGEQRGYFPTTLGATRAKYIPAEKRLIVENVADGIG
jgi:UDP-2,3-diacylglucosamine pyrophosphatase LpxH